jgi:predicted RNase H-related nuclease YkuK (DUF458 family)
MEKLNEMNWSRLSKGPIKEPLMDYLERIFEEEMENDRKIRVAVGTDSQKHGGVWKFATVILLMMESDEGVSHGAKVIYSKYSTRDIISINERMVREVAKSVEVAYEIYDLVDLYDFPLEIHADINPDPKWKSNKALSEAVGLILGMGYDFKIKPDAWASSKAADKLC